MLTLQKEKKDSIINFFTRHSLRFRETYLLISSTACLRRFIWSSRMWISVALAWKQKKLCNEEDLNKNEEGTQINPPIATWCGRNELRRWCKFLKMRDMSSTLLAYCDGLSTRISASSSKCNCNSLLSDLNSFLKSKRVQFFNQMVIWHNFYSFTQKKIQSIKNVMAKSQQIHIRNNPNHFVI